MKQGSFNVCETCGYKVISQKHFDNHVLTHAVQYSETPSAVDPVIETSTEVVVTPVVTLLDPVQMVSEDIILRFVKPVEIKINGIEYFGKEVTVKNMSIASEIVRLAREGYGPTILA